MARSDYAFFYPFRVRYSEIDGQMIVFNAHYLTYFDTAISEYFRALPYDYREQVKATGEDFHTVKTLVEYSQPIYFDQDIDVGVRTARIGRSSLTFRLEIHPKDEDSCLASGEVVCVNTDQTSQRSAALREELTDKLRALDGETMEAAS